MTFQNQVFDQLRIVIYQFTVYDITSETQIKSKRWGTESAIAEIKGEIIRDTKTVVDPSVTRSDIPGLTAIGYMPPL